MNAAKKVVGFGELMLRLSPPGYKRVVQTDSFNAYYGGAEANVCVSLAGFGIGTSYVTRLPDNLIGQAALNELKRYGVGTEHIVLGGERLGIYFMEQGASQRPSKVVYDRKYSAFSCSTAGDYDWDRIFDGADWFHFTGITPALSSDLAEITLQSCRKAREKGIRISCDLNYRANLWTVERASAVMKELIKHVDVLIANREHAEKILGVKADSASQDIAEIYGEVAAGLVARYGLSAAAITIRSGASASDNRLSVLLHDGKKAYMSKAYDIHIVDSIGAGDSLAAGLIYGKLSGMEPDRIVDFAAAAACLKHSVMGDFNHVSLEEVMALMDSDGAIRVQR